MSSCAGSVGVSPYTEDDAAYTTRLTLASRATTSRFTVASTFARLLPRGSSTDFGTDGIAAKADRGRGAVLQERHKRDLYCTRSVYHATDLHDAYRAGDGRSGLDGTAKEYIAAATTKHEQGDCQDERKEAFHWAPPGGT